MFGDLQTRLLKEAAAFAENVRAATSGLTDDHSRDIADALSQQDASIVARGARDSTIIRAAIDKLRCEDPELFLPAPLGMHLARLMIGARDVGLGFGGDNACLRAAASRMQVPDKRRCAYVAKKRLSAAGKPIPQPQPDDTNVADTPPSRAPQREHKKRDDLRPPHMRLGGMSRKIVRA